MTSARIQVRYKVHNLCKNQDQSKAGPGGSRHVFRQASSFIVIGLIQLAVEWAGFVFLTYCALGVVASNIISRGVAAIVGFYSNGHVTFKAHVNIAALARFVVVWAVLSALDTGLVYVIRGTWGLLAAQLSKPLVDGFIAILSFIVSRYWIYRPKDC